jgi:flagellar basal body rod protein FlgG
MDNTIAGITRYLGYDVDALNVASQNVANLRTPGYRAQKLAPDFSGALAAPRVHLDMSNGALEQTGRPLDVALQGAGFFTVDAGGGTTLLMRAGQLGIDSQGRLVDPAGHPVLGQGGAITVTPSATIRADGAVVDGGRVVDRLHIVDVAQPGRLQDLGGGLYAYDGTVGDWNGTLRAGALEQSNVDPGNEMVRLMEITRHAQSLQHAMEAYDQVLQAGINHIGDNG